MKTNFCELVNLAYLSVDIYVKEVGKYESKTKHRKKQTKINKHNKTIQNISFKSLFFPEQCSLAC